MTVNNNSQNAGRTPAVQKEFIEILNWKKYQDRMPDKGANWFKVHCSLANCEAFQMLDYKSQMTLISLWMFASEKGRDPESGRVFLKADKRYLFRNCRLLKEEPDLEPLLHAVDENGRPNPFIRYCDAPVDGGGTAPEPDKERALSQSKSARTRAQSNQPKKARAEIDKTASDPLYDTALKTAAYDGYISVRKLQSKFRIGVSRAKTIIETMKANDLLGGYFTGRGYAYKPALEKRNTDKRREDKSREDGILTDSGKEKEEREDKTDLHTAKETQQQEQQNPKLKAQRQKQALMQARAQDSEQKSVEPENPKESDEGAASMHHVPKQPLTSFRGGKPKSIGNIISGVFPEHWRDGDCEQFGWEIVDALGYSTDRQNSHSRSEWGAFAAWWSRLKAAVPGCICDEIRQTALKKAAFLNSPKARSARNKSAVWFKIMDGELMSRGITLPQITANVGAV